ncbi:MAG: glycosyltransferase family 2 protein [Planctomycetota bacterium]|nr:glycosyltransferase family 2 protein [Planctomycetota bacterium]
MADLTNNKIVGRILIIVPACDEAQSIAAVMADLRAHLPAADVVVVDDGSTDGTADVARRHGAAVLRLPCNLGVGGAMQTGYMYARTKDYDVAVQFDGDAQHRANQISAILDAVAGGADLAVGSRLLGGMRFRFHPFRFLGSRLLAALVSLIVRQKITDPTSGFRAASRRAVAFFAEHYPQTYLADTTEALVWAGRGGLKLTEVPVRMRQRQAGSAASGNIKGVAHMVRIILALLIDCFESRIKPQE